MSERWEDARNGVSTTSNGSLARLAVPDTGSLSLDGGLSAEGASVLGVLGDFHLLDLLSQGSTVARDSVLVSVVS
jgi:hypothetical protein